MPADDAPLSGILEDLKHTGEGETVSAGDVIEAFQHRSLGVMMAMFGLIAAMPIIGGIPGVSIAIATLILIAIGQTALGGGTLWMPRIVRKHEFQREKFNEALQTSEPWIAWVDHLVRPRLTMLAAGRPNRWIISIAAALLALTFYPLAIVPWGVTVPALGILAFGLGLMACDGLFVLIGYAFSLGTAYLLYTAVLG